MRYGFRRITAVLAVSAAMLLSASAAPAQDRDRAYDEHQHRFTRIEPGTLIAVTTQEPIDVDREDFRIFRGTVDQDVRGENGRLAIPRGSPVELIVRRQPDNDLLIDIESVRVEGQRYAIQTNEHREEARRDDTVIGAIVGAINHGQVQGRAVHIPAGNTITFRIQQPLIMGVADRGVDRGGYHYHDYDRDRP